MFGGLHLEKRFWNALEHLRETSGSADSFLKCTHFIRTRHAHQVTALTLAIFQKAASRQSKREGFKEWKIKMRIYPTILV